MYRHHLTLKRLIVCLAAALTLASASLVSAQQSDLFMTDEDGNLYILNTEDATATLIGGQSLPTKHIISGLSSRPGDSEFLYAIVINTASAKGSRLAKIKVSDGTREEFGLFDISGAKLEAHGIAISPIAISPEDPGIAYVTGVNFLAGANDPNRSLLWKVSLDTGAVVGNPVNLPNRVYNALTFSLDGSKLYGSRDGGPGGTVLDTINEVTGVGTSLGPSGLSNMVQGLAFRPENGVFFALDGQNASFTTDELWILDPANPGNKTEVGDGIGLNKANGIAFIACDQAPGANFCDGYKVFTNNACVVAETCPEQLCNRVTEECVDCLSANDCDDDGLFCNGPAICVDGACELGDAPCPTGDGVCDEDNDTCVECLTVDDCENPKLFCNGEEACVDNVCVPGTAPCPPVDAPEKDVCDELADRCVECTIDANCNDSLFCSGINPTCEGTVCVPGEDPCPGQECDEVSRTCGDCFTDDPCDDGVACTDDSCNIANHTCINEPNNAHCDDGLFCNGAEMCAIDPDNECVTGPDPCPGQLCDETIDLCVDCLDVTDCPPDDGEFCNGIPACVDGACEIVDPCPPEGELEKDVCDEDHCVECTENTHCDDGDFCNGVETCVNNSCVPGSSPCDLGQTCDEDNDVCADCESDDDCDNGVFCDGLETCVAGRCLDGPGDPCLSPKMCDENTDSCVDCLIGDDCEDDLFCTTHTCVSGTCVAEDTCVPEPLGDCVTLKDSCDEVNDECVNKLDDDECDDLNECTKDTCLATGECESAPYLVGRSCGSSENTICDDPDTCDGAGSCVRNYAPAGTNCSDGEFCNGDESCNGQGACLSSNRPCPPGAAPEKNVCDEISDICVECLIAADCEDGLFCTTDTCNMATKVCEQSPTCVPELDGCVTREATCNEVNNMCVDKTDDTVCDDGNDCTGDDSCDLNTGDCINDPLPSGTVCGSPLDTNCNNPDTCDGSGVCQKNFEADGISCGDGAFCNGAEKCSNGACAAGTPVNCDDDIDCTLDACDESTDGCTHVALDTECDDGKFCNGEETCDPDTAGADADTGCLAGTAVDCSDGVACTTDECNESTDECENTVDDESCDDDLFCNGEEFCDETDGCVSEGNPCTGTGEVCDEVNDRCNSCTDDAECVDDDPCTEDACNQGRCVNPFISGCADTDGDGVIDSEDGCLFDVNKTAPGICGCGFPDTDSDADGVANCLDLCLGTPQGTNVDANGCPVELPPGQTIDADEDGVIDENDLCPNTPAGATVDADGCAMDQNANDNTNANDNGSGTNVVSAPCGACGSVSMVSWTLLFLGFGFLRLFPRARGR